VVLDQLSHRLSPSCQQRLLGTLSRIVRQQGSPQPMKEARHE
jgi:hypothetical protein